MARIPVNKKLRQLRSLSALWQHRKQLFRMFREMYKGTYKASLLTMIALVAAVIYVVWPFDLVPDIIPIVGWIDDGFVIYFLLKRLLSELQRYQATKSPLKLVRR